MKRQRWKGREIEKQRDGKTEIKREMV